MNDYQQARDTQVVAGCSQRFGYEQKVKPMNEVFKQVKADYEFGCSISIFLPDLREFGLFLNLENPSCIVERPFFFGQNIGQNLMHLMQHGDHVFGVVMPSD